MISEDYFSVEILGESPLRLYETQYINMGSELDYLINENTMFDVVTENKVLDTIKHWIDVIIEKLKEFKKQFMKIMSEIFIKIKNRNAEYKDVKIPVISINGNVDNGISSDFRLNKDIFIKEIGIAYNYAIKNGAGPLTNDTIKVGEEFKNTGKSLTSDEFVKFCELIIKDENAIEQDGEDAIKKIRKYMENDLFDEDKPFDEAKEAIDRCRTAIKYIQKVIEASYKCGSKFTSQK
jgi:hypothetical protein